MEGSFYRKRAVFRGTDDGGPGRSGAGAFPFASPGHSRCGHDVVRGHLARIKPVLITCS